jgi:hypothetical protein
VEYYHQKLKLLFEFQHPAKSYLAVFKLGLDVQVDPSYSSVAPEAGGGSSPPKAKAAV